MNKIDEPRKQATIALKKAQSHIKNIIQMLDDGSYCIDVMTQIAAVDGLLKSASGNILKNHMRTCFSEGMKNQDVKTKEKLIQEVLDVVNLDKKQ